MLGNSVKPQNQNSHPKPSNAPSQFANNIIIQSSLGEKPELSEVSKIGMQLDDIITDLDKKLNRVLAK